MKIEPKGSSLIHHPFGASVQESSGANIPSEKVKNLKIFQRRFNLCCYDCFESMQPAVFWMKHFFEMLGGSI